MLYLTTTKKVKATSKLQKIKFKLIAEPLSLPIVVLGLQVMPKFGGEFE